MADIVGRTRSWIQVWATLFREGGITGLLVRGNSGGRKSCLNQAVKEAMIEKLRQGANCPAKQFQTWLREEHQIELSEKGVYYHLGKQGRALESAPSQPPEKRPRSGKSLS